MVNVQLSDAEAALLARSLEWMLSDVRMEMCDTDRADFREGLRNEKGVLEKVIEQLKQGANA